MEVVIKSYSNAKMTLLVFAFGFVIFFLRFTQPIITPTIYAEDGVWLGSAISNGWLHTLLNARPDYFVFFNVFFLFIAAVLSKIFSGNVLLLAPLFIALLSYSFYAITSTIIFWTVKRYTNAVSAWVAFGLSVLIPLGLSQAESFGTLVQVGFYMPILSICFHLFKGDENSRIKKAVLDLFIFLMAATNPVCFVVTGVYFLINFLNAANKKKFLLDMLPLLVALLVLCIIIAPRMNGSGGIAGVSYNSEHIIEMVTARSILYPFVFPFYHKLTNSLSLGLTGIYVGIVLFAYFRSEKKVKNAILLLAIMLIAYDVATVAGRSAITGLLTGYGATYPDRYFMGINIISTTLFAICLHQLQSPFIKYLMIVILIVVYAVGSNILFESASDKRRIALDFVFTNALCNAKDEGNGFKRVMILPSPDWYIRVPAGYIDSLGCVKI